MRHLGLTGGHLGPTGAAVLLGSTDQRHVDACWCCWARRWQLSCSGRCRRLQGTPRQSRECTRRQKTRWCSRVTWRFPPRCGTTEPSPESGTRARRIPAWRGLPASQTGSTAATTQPQMCRPLDYKGNYSATSNNTKLVHWLLLGGLLHFVQRGGAWAGCGPAQSSPRCTKCNSPPINGQCTNHCIAVWRSIALRF